MYGLIFLAALAGTCPMGGCGPGIGGTAAGGWAVPAEWTACKAAHPLAGLVVLFFEKAPGVGPVVEQEWREYIALLPYEEQCEFMGLWHRADVAGRMCLINQVRLMKANRDRARATPADPEKNDPPEGKPVKPKEISRPNSTSQAPPRPIQAEQKIGTAGTPRTGDQPVR